MNNDIRELLEEIDMKLSNKYKVLSFYDKPDDNPNTLYVKNRDNGKIYSIHIKEEAE